MEVFNFKEDVLPTNGDVSTFIISRTAHGKSELRTTVHEAAKIIHNIWQKADTCPMSLPCVKERCHKLLKDRQKYLERIQRLSRDPKNSLSEITKKKRMPSTGRELSKRTTSSKFKKKVEGHDLVVDEVRGLLEDIITSLEDAHEEPPVKKRALRSTLSPEQQWMNEVGCRIFDVFSEKEKQKVLKSGHAFDDEFLQDQKGERKLRMDLSKVTEEFTDSQIQREERERRHRNYVLSATFNISSVSHDFEMDEQEVGEDTVEPVTDLSDNQFISIIKTRAAQSQRIDSIMSRNSKRSTSTQTESHDFPHISTRLTTKKSKNVSLRLNPRLLATGSLMMGVAGVSTRQAIMCIKIAGNTLFHQNYILPPSLEKEYCK